MLHAGGANQAVTMQAMRHSDPRLTAVTYSDANLLPVSHAIFDLPNLGDGSLGSPIGSPNLDAEGQNLSQAVARDLRKKLGNEPESEEESRDLTQDDPKGHLYGGGSCGWIRTNDLVVNSHPLYR